jgi:hypothetical protein
MIQFPKCCVLFAVLNDGQVQKLSNSKFCYTCFLNAVEETIKTTAYIYARIRVHLLNSNSYLYQVSILVYDFNARFKYHSFDFSLDPV